MAGRRPSIRVRLALWSTVAVLAVVMAVGYAMTIGLRAGLRDRAHESLEVPFRVLEHQLARDPSSSISDILTAEPPVGERRDEVIGQVLDADARVIDSTGQPAARSPMVSPQILARATREGEWHEPRRLLGRPDDDIVVVVPISSGPRAGSFIVLAQSLAKTESEVERLQHIFLAFTPLVLLTVFLGSWLIARAALKPVDALTVQASHIDPEETDTVLEVPPGDDEISRLAQALNAMLGRLRHEIERERRFSADASHELRTPLALMATELDVSLRSADTPPAARPMLESVREDVARISRIVDDLMLLSRVESAGGVRLAVADEDLLDVAVRVANRFGTAARQREITIEVHGAPVVVPIDARLFGQAVANLVDNAVKFSPTGGRIDITVDDGEVPSITVTDQGVGIPADDLDRVFDRFFQVDAARSTGGSGLGLAIVRTIVHAHGGTIDVHSELGQGTRFTISLPSGAAG